METSLHKQLKEVYADQDSTQEFRMGKYRVDVRRGAELVEIQHGSLAAIRDKVRRLVKAHRVLVVKPIIAEKTIVRCTSRGGPVIGRRKSPKRGYPIDLFDELIYFVRAFPHRNLAIETPLVDVEEWRYPGHGRRRRWRKNDFEVEDQRLIRVHQTLRFETCADLRSLLPVTLTQPYNTTDLAEALSVSRWIAQRIAYCLRETGASIEVGKTGNSRLYRHAA